MLSLVDRQFIENEIESRIKTFVATERSTLKVLEELRNAPEVSLSMKIKTDGSKRKYASLGLACEGGYSNNFEWILNGSYIEEEMLSGVRNKSGNLACEVEYNTGGSDLDRGDRLLKVSGSFAASWSKAYTPIYNYQIKIVLPAAKGFELPLVFRWNMGSLLDEGTFTARLGAALDLAQVLGSSR
jgi:hypothetical protein